MKCMLKKYLTLAIGLILSGFSSGQVKLAENGIENSGTKISDEKSKLIYENTKTFPNNTEFAVAVIENNKVDFIGVKRTNDTIFFHKNHQNVFEIGSISKVFTAVLLSNFVTEQKLNLDDNIQEYLDFKIKIDKKITFKELANHTSRLPRLPSNLNLLSVNQNNPYKNYDSKKLTEYLTEKIKLNTPPGETYEYSNLGAGILGFELAKMFNSSYEKLLQEKIFKKYGMSSSTSQQEKVNTTIVKGLNPNGEITSNWDFDALAGGGAILSTVEDLSKFALAQFNKDNKELALAQQPTFTINEYMDIGLGWHILKTKSGEKLIWHNGGTGGYSSSMTLDVKNNNGIIILSNVSAFHKEMGNIDALCFALIRTLNKK